MRHCPHSHQYPKRILLFTLLLSCILAPIVPGPAAEPDEITIDDFKNGISSKWKEEKFHGSTRYTAALKDSHPAILAESDQSASGLFYEIDYAPDRYPLLEWSWQIEAVLKNGDARHKKGDDYAARLYVVFPSFLFWKTRALNYIWANKLPQGQFSANAYTSNAAMVAVESGNQNAGQWIHEQRNILQDYQQAFGEPPPKVGAIAIMTDTDDTKETANAWYGLIKIKKAPSQNQSPQP